MKVRSYILALDTGFANMGYAVVDTRLVKQGFVDAGCITTERGSHPSVALENIARCTQLFNRLATIMEQYPLRAIVAEYPFGGSRNMKAASAMAMSSAVVTCFALHAGCHIFPVTPNEVKRLVNPKPKAAVSKKEVIEFVIERYGSELLPENALREHTADAMAAYTVWLLKRTGFLP